MPPQDNNILGYQIPHQHHHAFATYGQFQNFLQQSASEWEAEAGPEPEETNKGHQYLAIHKTRPQLLSQVTEKSIRANLPRMRLHYDAVLEKLIVKLVNIHHDIAAAEFSETFLEHCQTTTIGISRRDLASLRASSHSYSSDGGQGLLGFKEPDDAFKPKNTRPRADDRPSMVIEVGMTESLMQLRADASHWLTRFNGEVRIVILMHIQRSRGCIRFENWQLRLSQPVLSDSSDRTGGPTMVQSFSVGVGNDDAQPGGSLTIPLRLLFDQIPIHTGTSADGSDMDMLHISEEALRCCVKEYFRVTQ